MYSSQESIIGRFPIGISDYFGFFCIVKRSTDILQYPTRTFNSPVVDENVQYKCPTKYEMM